MNGERRNPVTESSFRARRNGPGNDWAMPPRTDTVARATVIDLPDTDYGSLAKEALERLSRRLIEVTNCANPPHLIVDASKVEVIGARFLGILVSTWELLESHERRLAICGLRPSFGKLVRLMRLDRLFALHPNRRAALHDLNGRGQFPRE